MEPRRTTLRNAGAVIALSTPITAFISFAFFSVTLGEDRLEAASGTTALGYLALAMPVVVGLAIAGWAQFGGPLPSARAALATLGVFGALCIGLGIWSIDRSGADANIGGGLLVLFGLIAMGAGLAVRFMLSDTQPPPPQPPPPQQQPPPTAE